MPLPMTGMLLGVSYRVIPELRQSEERVERFFLLLAFTAVLGWLIVYVLQRLPARRGHSQRPPTSEGKETPPHTTPDNSAGWPTRPLTWALITLGFLLVVATIEVLERQEGSSLIDHAGVRWLALALAERIGGVINVQRLMLFVALCLFGGAGWCIAVGQVGRRVYRLVSRPVSLPRPSDRAAGASPWIQGSS